MEPFIIVVAGVTILYILSLREEYHEPTIEELERDIERLDRELYPELHMDEQPVQEGRWVGATGTYDGYVRLDSCKDGEQSFVIVDRKRYDELLCSTKHRPYPTDDPMDNES